MEPWRASPVGAVGSKPAPWLLPAVAIPVAVVLSALTDHDSLSVLSLGAGILIGLLLHARPRHWVLLVSYYALVLTAVGLAAGGPGSTVLAVGVTLAGLCALLGLVGRGLRLQRLSEPADVIRLAGLAAIAAALTPALTWLGGSLMARDALDLATLAQTCLTIAAGIMVGAPLVLSSPTYPIGRGMPGRTGELVGLAALTVTLLVLQGYVSDDSLTGHGPLFLLVAVLGWVAVRFGTWVTAAFLTVAATTIASSVAHGHGTLAAHATQLLAAVIEAQVYILVSATGVILLAVYAGHVREQDDAALAAAQLLTSAVEGADAALFVKRRDPQTGRFVYVEANTTFAQVLGRTPEEVVGRSDEDLIAPDTAAQFRAEDERVYTTGDKHAITASNRIGGRTRHYYALKFPVRDRSGTVVGVGGVSMDRTDEHRRENLLELVFSRSPVATAMLAWDGRRIGEVLDANESFAELVGLSRDRVVGQNLIQLLRPVDRPGTPAGPDDVALPIVRREMRLRRHDALELTVLVTATLVAPEDPADAFVLSIVEDVTSARAAEAGLLHRATHDPLTDMLNRQALVELLSGILARGAGARPAVLCCDLDAFKEINDTLGHDTGDRVLLEVADRVRRTVRPGDLVGRLGGDEFVVVCPGVSTESEAIGIAERLRAHLSSPMDLDNHRLALGVSVGIVVRSADAANAEDLLRQADVALTLAKDGGRDRVEVYRPELDRRAQVRLALRETIRLALSQNRVEVHAQPVVDLREGSTVGAEALVRLRDLDGSLLSPAAFIPVAEESGLIVPLGLRVLDHALAMRSRWAEVGRPIDIAVNVSPRQLCDPAFPVAVTTLLAAHGVPAASLTVEVTESTVVDATGPTLGNLQAMRDRGVHVAIDDFGTGYSSLTSLRDLPADIVKIDRSFVSGMVVDAGDEAIVRAVLAMAHATGRMVVAEGVETREQAARLADLGCDRVQGYWYSPPVPVTDFDPGRVFAAVSGTAGTTLPSGAATARSR